jgi:hypothetical protein
LLGRDNKNRRQERKREREREREGEIGRAEVVMKTCLLTPTEERNTLIS